MSAARPQPLLNVLCEWRDSSIAESLAIQEERWTDLPPIHDRKVQLQGRIKACYEEVNGLENPGLDPLVRAMVAELIQLERFNGSLLAEKRQAAEVERAEIEQTASNLRRMQRYTDGKAPAWAAYS
jgi:hypothetical protein